MNSTDKFNRKNEKEIINWDEVRGRIENVLKYLEHNFEIPGENRKEILRSRAKVLSQEPKKEYRDQESIEILEFTLAYEQYGVESSFIHEVYPLKTLTQLPCTPPFVLGIINVRGKILSVIDIKKFFDLPEKGLTDLNKVIILNSGSMYFGILADAITGIREIPLRILQSTLPTLKGIRGEYLKGITEERTIILDAQKLLSDKNIIVNEEVVD
jgi:purine-binding chemotaxis protein CheW